MRRVTRFVVRKLKLKVNEAKSGVTHPWWSKYLGFSFTSAVGDTRIRIHSKSMKRFEERVRELTARERGRSIGQVIAELNDYLRGWWGYFALSETRFLAAECQWLDHPAPPGLPLETVEAPPDQGAGTDEARGFAVLGGSGGEHPQGRMATQQERLVKMALPNRYFTKRSDWFCGDNYRPEQPNRRIRDPYVRWCGRGPQ